MLIKLPIYESGDHEINFNGRRNSLMLSALWQKKSEDRVEAVIRREEYKANLLGNVKKMQPAAIACVSWDVYISEGTLNYYGVAALGCKVKDWKHFSGIDHLENRKNPFSTLQQVIAHEIYDFDYKNSVIKYIHSDNKHEPETATQIVNHLRSVPKMNKKQKDKFKDLKIRVNTAIKSLDMKLVKEEILTGDDYEMEEDMIFYMECDMKRGLY